MAHGDKIIEIEDFGWVKDKGYDIEVVVLDITLSTIHMSKDNLQQLIAMLVAANEKLQETEA